MAESDCPFCSERKDAITDYFVGVGEGLDPDAKRICPAHRKIAYRVGVAALAQLEAEISKLEGENNDAAK